MRCNLDIFCLSTERLVPSDVLIELYGENISDSQSNNSKSNVKLSIAMDNLNIETDVDILPKFTHSPEINQSSKHLPDTNKSIAPSGIDQNDNNTLKIRTSAGESPNQNIRQFTESPPTPSVRRSNEGHSASSSHQRSLSGAGGGSSGGCVTVAPSTATVIVNLAGSNRENATGNISNIVNNNNSPLQPYSNVNNNSVDGGSNRNRNIPYNLSIPTKDTLTPSNNNNNVNDNSLDIGNTEKDQSGDGSDDYVVIENNMTSKIVFRNYNNFFF
jgi:hypothetical protein